MRVRFVDRARIEFLAEVAFYTQADPRVGQRFAKAVEECAARIAAFPGAGSPAVSNTRRVEVSGFPFSVFYREGIDGATIIAVAHHARRPGYWRTRA